PCRSRRGRGLDPVSLRRLGERGLIQRIRLDSERAPAVGVRVGIGDDAAVLAVTPGAALLATTDLVIEDVHFPRASASPEDLGWEATAGHLSPNPAPPPSPPRVSPRAGR